MGTLRFLLALSVVIFHTSSLFGFVPINGYLAVDAFFIISGFYMSLILNEKYIKKSGSYFLFITNRILRIYPLYLITLLAIFFLSLIKFLMGHPGPENFFYHYLFLFSNTSMPFSILPDFFNYIIRNITLIFTTDYFFLTSKSLSVLVLPQAWSLQREMFFYLLAPFLVRRNIKILLLVFIAYFILFFYWIDPHNILPKNLLLFNCLGSMFFFFLGMFSYKAYVFLKKFTIPPFIFYLSFFAVIAYTLFYNFVPQLFHLSINLPTDINYCLVIAILAPFLFIFGQKIPLDKLLGDLSYPIFITHVFFIKVLDNIPGVPQGNSFFTILTIAFSLIMSWLFIKFVDRRINNFRQGRVKR